MGEKEGLILQQALRFGNKIPDRIANAPTLEPSLVFYYEAWQELSTDRQFGMGVGPIPFTSVLQYGNHYEIEDLDDFLFFIRSLDAEYIKYANKDNAKKPT